MRRTLRGDDLYKAIFKEYVTELAVDNYNIEFFIEGTRSRTNKVSFMHNMIKGVASEIRIPQLLDSGLL